MKRFLVIFISTLVVAVLAIGSVLIIKRNHEEELEKKRVQYEKLISGETFPENTTLTVNDVVIQASNLIIKDVYEKYLDSQEDVIFAVLLNENKYELNITDYYKHSLDLDDFQSLIKNITFEDYVNNDSYEFVLEDNITYDENVMLAFQDFLDNVEYDYIESKDAILDKENYIILPEVYGTEIDKEKVLNKIKDLLNNDELYIEVNETFYIKPNILEEDLKVKYKDLFNIYNWSARYKVTDYVIEMKDYMEYVTEDENGRFNIDTSFMKKAVLALSKTVDENGKERVFKSTLDGEISVSGGTYGQIMDNNKEIEYLISKLDKRESVVDRVPVWKVEPKDKEYENTYIEIDLSEQHVWYYKDNELVMDSNCVTGTKGTSRATPTGFYFVSEKVDGKYLIGPGYKTWVDKWMRITDRGHGLHDAQWRKASEFNNKTYTYDGSHGCINLPKQFAYDLYDAIEVGVLVVVHD